MGDKVVVNKEKEKKGIKGQTNSIYTRKKIAN